MNNKQNQAKDNALQKKKVQLVLHRKSTQAQAVYRALHGTALPRAKATIREVINLDQAVTMLEQHGEVAGKWWADRLRRRCLKLKRCTIGFRQRGLEVEPFWEAESSHVRRLNSYSCAPELERGPTEDPETGMPTTVVIKHLNGQAVIPNDPFYIAIGSAQLFQLDALMREDPQDRAASMEIIAYGHLKHLELHPDLVAAMIHLNKEENTGADKVLLKMLRERPEFAELEKDVYQQLPKFQQVLKEK